MDYWKEKKVEVMYCDNCRLEGRVSGTREQFLNSTPRCKRCGNKLSLYKSIGIAYRRV